MIPVLFEFPKIAGFGPFKVHSFGVMMMLAFMAGLWLARKRAPRFGVDANKITDMGFWALIAGVLGARIVYIAQEWETYSRNLNALFSIQFSGLTSFGGLIFAVIALGIMARRNGIPMQRIFDICAPAFAVGHILGRVGCFLNGCCYGGVCSSDFIFATQFVGLPNLHHPAQLYDVAMNLVALGLLFWLEKRNLRMGQISAYYLGAYGLTRFIYEFWRAGTPAEVERGLASSTTMGSLPITEAQLMAAVLVIAGIVWFILARRNPPEFETEPEAATSISDKELQPA